MSISDVNGVTYSQKFAGSARGNVPLWLSGILEHFWNAAEWHEESSGINVQSFDDLLPGETLGRLRGNCLALTESAICPVCYTRGDACRSHRSKSKPRRPGE